MQKSIIILLLIFASLPSFSQENNFDEPKKHYIGATAGFTTGVGFSYGYFPNNFGLQITGMPIKTDDYFFYNIGLTAFYKLYNKKRFSTYLYLSNLYVSENENKEYNLGGGFGIESGKFVVFRLMIGYGFFDVIHAINIFPTCEIGLYYKF